MQYPQSLLKLIRSLAGLPGVGPRTAQKLGLFLVQNPGVAQTLEGSLRGAAVLHLCPRCGNLAEDEFCPICAAPDRRADQICVVETINDLMAIERSGEFEGLYHVLQGVLNPLEGIGPEQLNLEPLFGRLAGVAEVILATSMTVEGEATAGYLSERLTSVGIPSSRLAYGLPVGGSLEHADEVTLGRALENRRRL